VVRLLQRSRLIHVVRRMQQQTCRS